MIFKYQIYPAKNGARVKTVMDNRCSIRKQMWIQASNLTQSHFHFRWATSSRLINFDRFNQNFMQVANHYEGHFEVSRKHELYNNVRQHLESKASNCKIFNMMPVQFYIKLNQENKNDRVSKKEIKATLNQLKQVFKLLDSFKTCNLNEDLSRVGPKKRCSPTPSNELGDK